MHYMNRTQHIQKLECSDQTQVWSEQESFLTYSISCKRERAVRIWKSPLPLCNITSQLFLSFSRTQKQHRASSCLLAVPSPRITGICASRTSSYTWKCSVLLKQYCFVSAPGEQQLGSTLRPRSKLGAPESYRAHLQAERITLSARPPT